MAGLRRWCLAMAVVALGAGPLCAQAAPPIEVDGATYAELDDATGIWTLRGAPVAVRRGDAVIEAAALTYETRAQLVRAAGGVTYRDDALFVSAPRMTAWLGEGRLLAEGGVTARVPDATLEAGRVEAFAGREEVVADEGARLIRADLEGRAPRIVLQRRLATVTLSGGAVLWQERGETRAATITVDLRRRRVTASGAAAITLHPDR